MFADMGIQPGVADAFLISQGLTRASASTDTTAATASIDDLPDTVAALSPVTITGTATDNDGNPLTADGKVAVVEVSLDGGTTWQRREHRQRLGDLELRLAADDSRAPTRSRPARSTTA